MRRLQQLHVFHFTFLSCCLGQRLELHTLPYPSSGLPEPIDGKGTSITQLLRVHYSWMLDQGNSLDFEQPISSKAL